MSEASIREWDEGKLSFGYWLLIPGSRSSV